MAISDVLVGAPLTGTGGVLRAPVGTERPTSAVEPLDPGFVPQGYVGEDGVTQTVDRSTEKVKAWGGQTVRIVQTDFAATFAFSFLETTDTVLKALHGDDNVTGSGDDLSVAINAESLPASAWVFEMKDGDTRLRIVLPNAQVTEVGETTFSHNAVTARPITIEALPDEDGNVAYMYKSAITPGS